MLRVARLIALSTIVAVLAGTARAATPEEWTSMLDELGVEHAGVRELLTATEAMRDFAESVAGESSTENRLRALAHYLHDERRFAFHYENQMTLTAGEAFDRRAGNCVSSTILFISLARSLGIPVQAALAKRSPDRDVVDDLIVVNNHLVAIHREATRWTLFDFNQRGDKLIGYEPIDDRRLAAIYLNNKGVERLIAGDYDGARDLLFDAIRLSPGFVDSYGNLGVAYRRLGRTEAALDSYLVALTLAPSSRWVRENLRAMFSLLSAERRRSGAVPAGLPAETAGRLARGDDELAAGSPRDAARSYAEAARLSPDRAEPLVATARLRLHQGRVKAARRTLLRALELDPENEEAVRLIEALDRAAVERAVVTRP